MKKILSIMLTLVMVMSTAVSYASEKTDYNFASYTTTGAGDFTEVDLDEIFKAGKNYKITFNVKPDEITSGDVSTLITVADGNIDFGDTGMARLYKENGRWYMNGNGKYYGDFHGFYSYILKSGFDVEISWNTDTGAIGYKMYMPQNPNSWGRVYTNSWTKTITEGQRYGKLKIGSKGSAATIRDLKIRDLSKDPAYSYSMTSFTTASGGYWRIPLDEIIKTGNNYNLKWNMKPSDFGDNQTSGTWLIANIVDGSMGTIGNGAGLFDVYTEGSNKHGHGLGAWGKIGWLNDQASTILSNGVDMELVWNTEDGTVTIKVSIGTQWSWTYDWTPGNVEGSYGYLSIGAPNTAVTISNLKIRNADMPEPEPEPEPEPDPAGKYELASHTTNAGEYLKVNLNDIFVPGMTYNISFNMKPDSIDTTKDTTVVLVNVLDGEVSLNQFGLFDIYTEGKNGGVHYHQIGAWKGSVADYTETILSNGVDVKLVWDTAEGACEITAAIGTDASYSFTWSPGKISANFGKLAIGGTGAVTITDLKIDLPDNYETVKPIIKSEYIKFKKYDDTVIDFSSKITPSVKEIVVSFPVEMKPNTLNKDTIVLKKKKDDTDETVKYTNKEKTVSSYIIPLDNLLDPNCKYEITFDGSIANVLGKTLGSSQSFVFETENGEFKTSIEGVSVGTNKNPTMSEIKQNGSVATNVKITNTMNKPQNYLLILTYYSGNELKAVEYKSISVEADKKYEIKEIASNISVPADCDSLHIFLWDGIKTMLSYDKEFIIR